MVEKVVYKELPLDQLSLDLENPRLPTSFSHKTEVDVINFMLLQASTLELMQAIGNNDFFKGEQLLVVPLGGKKDSFIVIEGNRRLTAVKLLNDPSLAQVQKNRVKAIHDSSKFKPTLIPCLIFNEKQEILDYLGYRHITGVKAWKTLEKARYLTKLRETHYKDTSFDETCVNLTKMIGSKKDYVRRLLVGYQIYQEIEDQAFYEIEGLNDTNFYFNYIADSLSRGHIAKYLGVDYESDDPLHSLNLNHLKEWTHWLFEKKEGKTRLKGKSEDLAALNKILAHEDAKRAFIERGISLDKALELTDDLRDQFYSSIKSAIENLEHADRLIHKLKGEFYHELSDDLEQIKRLFQKLRNSKNDIEDEL